jgi:formylglycine-generating enzyme required for sulfatase activity
MQFRAYNYCNMLVALLAWFCLPSEMAFSEQETNSLGIELVAVEPGNYLCGSKDGNFDERPVHQVSISHSFLIGVTPVTNKQFEQFDPSHRQYRGLHGISNGDQEAVVYVTWHQATEFCKWLSEREGYPYRLPTEAEWEFAARAGTTTAYFTGEDLPQSFYRSQEEHWKPEPVDLATGRTPANAWGLRDVHGIVEEWCSDWYGPYSEKAVADPIGPAVGQFRVTRGGSHSTPVQYLSSAARFGTLPEDRHWLIGFRVVLGALPASTTSGPTINRPIWASNVSQGRCEWRRSANDNQPVFVGPKEYVKIKPGSNGPLFSQHNHCPAISVCPNGDLLAIWYSTPHEDARELGLAASRLRLGANEWEPAEPFWNAPGRNDHGEALWWDGDQTLYHFNGLGAAGTWGSLALIMRTSVDNGATWSSARIIDQNHGLRNMPISNVIRTSNGKMFLTCDAATGGSGGTAVHVSVDEARTWSDPGRGKPAPAFRSGETGSYIAGIHAGLVELGDHSLCALGRGNNIDGQMPKSISHDDGKTWCYSASGLPAIDSGQRLALLRLNEGPLLLFSFTGPVPRKGENQKRGMSFVNSEGRSYEGYGLFAALSYDDGNTWPHRKLVTTGGPPKVWDGGAWTGKFEMDATHAEPAGYLDATQSPDGTIHLISSKLYYQFNLAWLRSPADANDSDDP